MPVAYGALTLGLSSDRAAWEDEAESLFDSFVGADVDLTSSITFFEIDTNRVYRWSFVGSPPAWEETILDGGSPGGGSPSIGIQEFHGVKAYNAATQSVGASAVALALNSEEYDTDGYHDTSSGNTKLTIPSGLGGYYRLTGFLHTASNPGAILMFFRKNGTTDLRVGPVDYSAASSGAGVLVTTVAFLSAGDYVEVMGFCAGTVNVGHASNVNQQVTFSAELVGV